MASKFGLVKRETLDVYDSFAGLGEGLGKLSGGPLTKFSEQFTSLAADLQSYANIDFDSAAKALSTGLAGNQSDILKGLGVIVDETTIKQYALAHGMAAVGGQLTEQQKLMARAGVIAAGLADATGDLDRTQDSVANKSRKFAGQMENLSVSIGQMLLPAVSKTLDLLVEFGNFAQSAFEGSKEACDSFGASLTVTFDTIGVLFRNWQSVFEIARLSIVQGLMNLGEHFDVLGQNIGIIATYIAENWVELIRDAFNATLTLLQNLAKNWQAIGTAIGEWLANPTGGFNVDWTPLLDGFEATAKELPKLLEPHLTDMSDQIQREMDKIGENEAARMDGRALRNNKRVPLPKPADVAKMVEPKFAAALDINSQDARSAILKAMAGRTNRTMEQAATATAANTAATARSVQRLAEAAARNADKVTLEFNI
jgi:hypothetical protein